jgi:hypothetical protein
LLSYTVSLLGKLHSITLNWGSLLKKFYKIGYRSKTYISIKDDRAQCYKTFYSPTL